MAGFCAQTPVLTLRSVSVCGLAALGGHPVAFHLFLPQPCAVHYMPLEECRRGAAKRERVLRSAHEGEKSRLFFGVISRSGTVRLHVGASFFTYGWQRHGQSDLITPTYFHCRLITSPTDFFLVLRRQHSSVSLPFGVLYALTDSLWYQSQTA